uniref:MADS58 n=1 Tax=Hippophae rhamnoides TaxID=193516 RepID=A0AAU7LJH2_9ROSA
MTRKKVKLAYITNDAARKATFKKRKKGLVKKLEELTTLCDIDVCAIMFSPYDSQPEVFPSQLGVQRVLSKFKRMPEMEQCKKMMNQESFIKQRISKTNDQLKKIRKENREKELTRFMFQSLIGMGLQGFNMMDLNELNWLIDQNLKDIHKKMESLKKESSSSKQIPTLAAAKSDSGTVMVNGDSQMEMEMEKSAFEINMDVMQRQPWFMDLVNPRENVGFCGEDMILPFGDQYHNALWSIIPFQP